MQMDLTSGNNGSDRLLFGESLNEEGTFEVGVGAYTPLRGWLEFLRYWKAHGR